MHESIVFCSTCTMSSYRKFTFAVSSPDVFLVLCCCEATDNSCGFVVFTTKSNLVTLCNADVITMDGTFRVCPKFFHQLYTIHGYLNEHYIPLVHCLLSHKAMATYVRMLNTIQSNCAAINLCFSPQDAVVDFEISMLAAVDSTLL